MMRHVRVTIGTFLAATLLTLCVGLQVLEATGRWDQTIQDTGDEAVIVTVVLCIGAALVVARVARSSLFLSVIRSWIILIRDTAVGLFASRRIDPTLYASPPVSLRI